MNNIKSKISKSPQISKLIIEALDILEMVGIPIENKSFRALERMALCFIAVSGIRNNWSEAKSSDDGISLKTRDIISILNTNFEEKISPGSYDDIRRKDLKLLVLAGFVTNSGIKRGSATNDPTRGYALLPEFKNLIITYKTEAWDSELLKFKERHRNLSEILSRKRDIEKIPVLLPNDFSIELSAGEHNLLQKHLIEEFLPRFGSGSEVLYIGDTAKKILFIQESILKELNFFELSHDELPDIIAYDRENNWLFLIEAVHSSGPMNETRVFELKNILQDCKASLIFVTGFLTRNEFRKWISEIAWETEVWIADNPDHLIHFDGHKFLGPYDS